MENISKGWGRHSGYFYYDYTRWNQKFLNGPFRSRDDAEAHREIRRRYYSVGKVFQKERPVIL